MDIWTRFRAAAVILVTLRSSELHVAQKRRSRYIQATPSQSFIKILEWEISTYLYKWEALEIGNNTEAIELMQKELKKTMHIKRLYFVKYGDPLEIKI